MKKRIMSAVLAVVMIMVFGVLPCVDVTASVAATATTKTTPMISAGNHYTVALKADGTVWAWGNNEFGQLGDGTMTSRNRPVQVQGLTNVISVSAGLRHATALKADGTVWTWGDNSSSQLGDGTTTNRSNPVQVLNLSSVVSVSAGLGHATALKADGTVWAWGQNNYGQLGDGTTTNHSAPVQVSSLSDIISISAGGDYTTAVKSDGTVWAWGFNGNGKLGDGTTTNRSSPVQVSDLSDVVLSSSGFAHTTAIKSDGTVWAWGCNTGFILGVNAAGPRDRLTPEQVTVLSNTAYVSAGWNHTVALKSDGTVWAWGRNASGLVGDGTTVDRPRPVQVSSLSDVISISAGLWHTVALKSDGTVWAWGNNRIGQLGDGTTTDRNRPVRVVGKDGVGFFNVFESSNNLGDLFRHDSSAYNNDLAIFAAELSEAAYGVNAYDKSAIENKLKSLGFNENAIFTENYSANLSTVGFSVASTKIRKDNREKNLVVITVRGTPPPSDSHGHGEWYNNIFGINSLSVIPKPSFDPNSRVISIDSEETHNGLQNATENLFKHLDKYLTDQKLPRNASDNVFLITGHSRGGGVANLLAERLNRTTVFARLENTYVYTFASMNATRTPVKGKATANIINIINKRDLVPTLPDNTGTVKNRWGRHGVDLAVNMPNVAGSHDMETYIACLKKEDLLVQIYEERSDGKNDSIWAKILSWQCPVDIEILDSNGNAAAVITDGVAISKGDSEVFTFMMDGVKHAFIPPSNSVYTAKAIATVDGMLTFTVETIDDTTDALLANIKTFENVTLTKGKELISEVGGTAVARLFVVKNGVKIAEVAQNGTERVLAPACSVCQICKSGQPPRVGHILGNATVTTADALEVLKYIVKLPGAIGDCENARTAATIMGGAISTADALEILKKLVKLPNRIDGTT